MRLVMEKNVRIVMNCYQRESLSSVGGNLSRQAVEGVGDWVVSFASNLRCLG